jgi:hypothetical protein
VRWTHTLDTWTAEAGGQQWTIGERPEEPDRLRLLAGGGYVATFRSVEAAKREAARIARADDVPAELLARRVKAGYQAARHWVKMARAAHGGKP